MAKRQKINSKVSVFDGILPPRFLGEVLESLERVSKSSGLQNLYQAGSCSKSFWYPLDRRPTNVYERLVRHLHKAAGIPKSCIGGEWWFNIRPANTAMQGHFDKDESVLKVKGEFVHPVRSSVYYLTDRGVPTMIYNVPSWELLGYLKDEKRPFETCSIPPKKNRYAIFDGSLFHGAAYVENSFTKLELDPNQPRIVLAVNWWKKKPAEPYCVDYDPSWGEEFYSVAKNLTGRNHGY